MSLRIGNIDPDRRCGAATVEFALTAPILFLLCFACIEFSRAHMLLHTARIAASAGARAAIVSGATAADAIQATQEELDILGVRDAEILVYPTDFNNNSQVVTLGVQIPLNARNGYLVPRFFLGKKIIKLANMTREAKSTDEFAKIAKTNSQKMRQMLESNDGK